MATTTATTRLAPVNGIELAYEIHGNGKPLVLLHGGFGAAGMFGPNISALTAGRQVVGVDLQSHGRTPAIHRPMRFETMADDIAELIRYLGHEQADVMGFSLTNVFYDRYVAPRHPGPELPPPRVGFRPLSGASTVEDGKQVGHAANLRAG